MEDLIITFFNTWQVKTLIGLVTLDVVLGVAKALRLGVFEWQQLATFYKTNVLPYILGYLVLFTTVTYVIPPDTPGLEVINTGLVNTAWVVLVASLLASIMENVKLLYQSEPAPPETRVRSK